MSVHPLRRSLHLLMAFALVLSQLMLLAPSTALAAPVVTVNSVGDAPDSAPGNGICETAPGNAECTLRAAIEEANASGPVDEIHFAIPGAPGTTHVIEPLSVLPWITGRVSIDATTQAGFAGTPLIVLDGSSAPSIPDGPDGLMVDANRVTIEGLTIRDWIDDGIEIHSNLVIVVGNHIYNNDEGVLIENGSNNTIGGSSPDDRNVIADNRANGVSVDGGSGNQVLGNIIGLDASSSALPNAENGVYIWGGATNATVEGNVVSENGEDGIRIEDDARGTDVRSNHVGTNAAGTADLGNGASGIHVGYSENVTIGAGNVISGNGDHGVHIDQAAVRVTITGSRIGTNAAGTAALGNSNDGVYVEDADRVWIGPANVISGNGGDNQDHGVHLEEDARRIEIFGNRIGTDGSGSTAIPNATNGVHADADDVVIEDNQVSGNGEDGLRLEQEDAIVRGNLIGTDSAGTGAIPNGDDGIDTGSGTTGSDIGGISPGEGNVIAFNTDDGISLRNHTGTQAAIVSNSIFANGGLGIDLPGDGPNSNDTGPPVDGDNGPNDLLNYPEVTRAEEVGGTVYVDFDLPVPSGRYWIQFFANPSGGDPSGYGEGETLVSSVEVFKTWGTSSFSHSFSGAAGDEITATATRCRWLSCTPGPSMRPRVRFTSEFSPAHTVTVGNHAPVLGFIPDVTANEETDIQFTVSATDADDDDLTFDLIPDVDPVPTDASIDPSTGVFSWTPDEDQGPGSYTFGIRVTDDGELGDGTPMPLSDSQTITITVNEANQPPELVVPGVHTVDEHTELTFTATATDDDLPANTLTFGLADGPGDVPAGASITSDGDFTWTPDEDQGPIAYTFEVTVTDGTAIVSKPVNVFVNEVNEAPTLDFIPDVIADEDTWILFTATASDLDLPANTFTYGLVNAPAGASITSDGDFAWRPTESQGPGDYTFDITVNDGAITDSQTITITVNEANRPPVLADPGDHTIPEHSPFTFTATATDPDQPANTFTYGLVNAPAGASIDPDTGVFTWTPSEAQGPLAYTFTVTVTDGTVTDSEPVNIFVTEVNSRPTLTNPGHQSDAEADTVDLPLTATDPDQPANSLTYTAAGLPPGLDINPHTGRITGTITYDAAVGSPHHVTITVHDNGNPNRNDSVNFNWVTDNTNRAPNLDSLGNKTISEQATLTFTVTATDPDPGTTLTYSLIGAPSGATINPYTGTFTWTPTEAQGPSAYALGIRVNDNDPTTPLTDVQTITITVNEVNSGPEARSDSASTPEDTPVLVPVLDNDSDVDLPANRLRISEVSTPGVGGSVEVTAGGIVYSPPEHYHGTVFFTYTVFDGIATDSATVAVEVTPVNDVPVARDDGFRLTTYQPVRLDVLANDTDADGDPLGISLKGRIPRELTLKGNELTFDPISGWTGKVTFEYVIHDPKGASSSATVEVIVGDEVLVGAQRLADQLGADLIPFDPPAPSFDAQGLSLIDLGGITLLADSFFQTVDALRIPLGFLGVTVVMVVGLGATSDVPALVFGTRRRHWAVVRLGRQQRLPAYKEPGGRKVAYNYDPTAAAIVSIGKIRAVGNTEWLPVETPNGKAWIYRQYLTEHVDLKAFAEDPRPARLVHELAKRLREGKTISSLISDDGLVLALTGSPSQIAPEELAALMGDRRLRHYPGLGTALNTPEEFTLAVARPFLEAYDATPEVTAETPHSRSALIPTECWNFPYLAIGPANGVQPWLVFFEYRNGKAFIAGLGIDE